MKYSRIVTRVDSGQTGPGQLHTADGGKSICSKSYHTCDTNAHTDRQMSNIQSFNSISVHYAYQMLVKIMEDAWAYLSFSFFLSDFKSKCVNFSS